MAVHAPHSEVQHVAWRAQGDSAVTMCGRRLRVAIWQAGVEPTCRACLVRVNAG